MIGSHLNVKNCIIGRFFEKCKYECGNRASVWILSDITLTAPHRWGGACLHLCMWTKTSPISGDGGDVPELNLLVFQL